jgi:hypothetical protein
MGIGGRRLPSPAVTSALTAAARGFAAGLCALGMPALARADEENQETGLALFANGAHVAARHYGAGRVMHDHPAIATIALVTTTVMACGAAFRLLRSSAATTGPAVAPQNSIGATVMAGCTNLNDEIKALHGVRYDSPILPALQAIDGWTDALDDLVTGEIDAQAAAPSLGNMRQCIEDELKEGALRTLRTRLQLMSARLRRPGVSGIAARDLAGIRTTFNTALDRANAVDEKLGHTVDRLTAEINRQQSANLASRG